MKKTILAIVSLCAAVGAMAQGNILFQNKVAAAPPTPAVDGKVVDQASGSPVAASKYYAELWMGTSANSLAPAIDLTSSGVIRTLITTSSGYFAGGAHGVKDFAAGVDAFFQVKVYDQTATSYDQAVIRGQSAVLPIKLTAAPATPAAMVGISAIQVALVPEPSILALGVLGLGAFVLRRRM